MDRRHFLKALGLGAAALLTEEPVKKLWFVPSTAPVGSRIERVGPLERLAAVRLPPPVLDMDEFKALLRRKVRSQEDLDALRKIARRADASLVEHERKRLITEMFGPPSRWPINEFGYDPEDDDDLRPAHATLVLA